MLSERLVLVGMLLPSRILCRSIHTSPDLHSRFLRGALHLIPSAPPLQTLLNSINNKSNCPTSRVLPYSPTPDSSLTTNSLLVLAHVVLPKRATLRLSGSSAAHDIRNLQDDRDTKISIFTGCIILDGDLVLTCQHTFDQVLPVAVSSTSSYSSRYIDFPSSQFTQRHCGFNHRDGV